MDYKIPELFLGCASPQSYEQKHRYHCEVDYDFFTMIKEIVDKYLAEQAQYNDNEDAAEEDSVVQEVKSESEVSEAEDAVVQEVETETEDPVVQALGS